MPPDDPWAQFNPVAPAPVAAPAAAVIATPPAGDPWAQFAPVEQPQTSKPPSIPTSVPDFLNRVEKMWQNPPHGPSIIGALRSMYDTMTMPGNVAAGEFSPQPEKPGFISEEDLVRQNAAGNAFTGGVLNMAGNVILPNVSGPARTIESTSAKEAAKEVGATPRSIKTMSEAFKADNLSPEVVATKQQQFGPEAMALDMGRQSQLEAENLAARGGSPRRTVLDAVEQRVHGTDGFGNIEHGFGKEAANRLKATLDQNFGPSQNKVELLNAVDDLVQKHATPLYEKVMADHPIVDVPGAITSRPAISSAMKNAGTLARQYGEVVDETARPSLRYWDYVKKDMDRRINGYIKSGGTTELNSADKADLGGLISARNALRDHLDAVTGGAYADARRVAAFKPDLNEAYEVGRNAFNNKLLPEEFAEHLKDMSIPEQGMARAGYRRELENILDTAGNEGATARRALRSNSRLEKTENLFGPQARQAVEDRIGAEAQFQDAATNIARNSRTAVREAMRERDNPYKFAAPEPTVPGLLLKPARALIDRMQAAGRVRDSDALARMSTMTGPNLQNLAEVLARYANPVKTGAPISPLGQALAVPRITVPVPYGQPQQQP